ncbi:MAG: hypothetical protein H6737_15215 [Alphaproteobacteria bacterium]|nr:hypothetical protein [Alphaproteobacteria bacterium]
METAKRDPIDPETVPAFDPEKSMVDQRCLARLTQTCDIAFTVPEKGRLPTIEHAIVGRCHYDPGECYRGPPVPPPP